MAALAEREREVKFPLTGRGRQDHLQRRERERGEEGPLIKREEERRVSPRDICLTGIQAAVAASQLSKSSLR